MDLITKGRTDLEHYFEESLKYALDCKNKHCPFLVFEKTSKKVEVHIIEKATEVIRLFEKKPKTKIMKQWRGEWRSDFMHFTVGELKELMERL